MTDGEIIAVAAKRVRGAPGRCPLRILAEATLELNPIKIRVEIEAHRCRETPPCRDVLRRDLLGHYIWET